MKITTKLDLFSPIWKQKQHNELSPLLELKEFKKGKIYTDEYQICSINFKNEELEQLFWETFNVQHLDNKKPMFNQLARSEYDVDFLINLLKIFKTSSYVTLTMGTDTPLKLENNELEINFAPRIDENNSDSQKQFSNKIREQYLSEFTDYELEIELEKRTKKKKLEAEKRTLELQNKKD